MLECSETLAHCHSCGYTMHVSGLPPFSNAVCPSCGEHTRVNLKFGPYTLVRRHAAGGMSMVFVAHDDTLHREVALKILSEEFSASARRIAAFQNEAQITASFSHPHVVQVLTTGKAFGRFYIAMELVPGGHFEHQIRERGKIPEVEMLPLAIEVAQGLKAAHSAGLIHRDVKPGNILLDAEGHAKIVDFGLALVTQGGKAQATEVWATSYYVPPETIEGQPEDLRSDIYAFGATLYHALTGKPSCGEQTMATYILREAKKKVRPLGVVAPSLSVDTCRIVDRAMAYEPKDRFSSYDEMILMLELALKRVSSVAPGATESSGIAAKRQAQMKRVVISLTIAVVVTLAAVSAGIWWVTRKAPALVVSPPLPLGLSPIRPELNSAAIHVAKSYRQARAAVETGEFAQAAGEFAELRDNPAVQEPTRSWAGVEAVLASYLDGQSSDASRQAKEAAAHALAVPEGQRIGKSLIDVLVGLSEQPTISEKVPDASVRDASHVMAWMLAGLKDWELGLLAEAGGCFSAVASAKISPDQPWLRVYQNYAKDYLADHQALSSAVFEKLPGDAAACAAALAELDGILGRLKTRGRAQVQVRAWQLDLERQAKLLASAKLAPIEPPPAAPVWLADEVMLKLDGFAKDCHFSAASAYLKSFSSESADAMRASLLILTASADAFFSDLEGSLHAGPVSGEFPMKSGEVARKISIDPAGSIMTTDAKGKVGAATWRDFSPGAIIALHRICVKNLKSEGERLRRHECAISYDWLVGNREHALAAAALLSQGSASFRQHWETIARSLPK